MNSVARGWTFFTNHGHALVYLASHPDARVREIAAAIGISERATQGIMSDLVNTGYVTATKSGRRNSYQIDPTREFRHPIAAGPTVGDVLALFTTARTDAHDTNQPVNGRPRAQDHDASPRHD